MSWQIWLQDQQEHLSSRWLGSISLCSEPCPVGWLGLAGCVCRDVSPRLLSSPLCLGQQRGRCEGTARSGSPRSSRSLLRRDHRGCRKSSASEAAAPLPRDGSDRRNSTYEAGGLLPSRGDSGCDRSRVPLPSPSAAPFTTWDPFQSVSLGTKEPGQFLHLKAADRGCCCSLRECWEANPWREAESRKIIVVVIHLCLTSEHPAGLRCCHGTVALRFLNGFITYQPAGSGLCFTSMVSVVSLLLYRFQKIHLHSGSPEPQELQGFAVLSSLLLKAARSAGVSW